MTRRPRSLFGRIMATVALALLLGQSIAALLLYRASEERREARMVDAAALQLAIGGAADRRAARGALRGASRGLGDRPRPMRGLPPALRYRVSEAAPVAYPEWSGPTPESERIATLLAEQGIAPATIATAFRRAGDDPGLIAFARARPRFAAREQWRDRRLLVAAIQREPGGVWHVARVAEPRREPRAIGTLLVQTAILFASLLGFLYWQLRRITLPLARLTGRVEHIGAPGRGSEPMAESGPEDVARLIRAYNAAEARIAALLDEKDVMLGAIGHDLKTPLAALRVRIEIVEDATERARMVRGVEKITTTLDDILTLARLGRAAHPPERTDLSALAASVVSEYEDLGEAVRLMDDQRIVATVHAGWVQRALRNLIDNALRHGGGAARMSVYARPWRGGAGGGG